MTRPIRPGEVAALREQLRGWLVSPDDPRYDAARKVWNGRIDRRPSFVAFCADEKEVVIALRFAREHELLVAVRGGGHSCAGTAVCDDGFVIDLSPMKAIEVDAAARSAQAQGGVLWGELDRATQAFGLAVPGGTDSEVGIAGLTLGGGNGCLMGVHGATCDTPDTLTVYACLICDGDRPVVAITACYVGSADRAEATVASLRKWGTIVTDQLRPMSYVELQSLFDGARPAGRRCAMRSNFMAGLPDAAIEILVEGYRTTPSPLSAVIVEHCHGAIARVAPDATAFGLRSNPYHLEILGFWDQAEEDAANLAWVERLFADVQPFNTGEVYVNSLDEGEGHRVREAYGINYTRLVALKAKFDPTNFFRCNHNIAPR